MNAPIKERPILFSEPMVRAILDGRKTQTRRAINPQPELTNGSGFKWKGMLYGQNSDLKGTCRNFSKSACKFGKPGDRLWVRETFLQDTNGFIYRADGDFEGNAPILGGWKPSIHMPRSASRILLEITNIRVERLQHISEKDAVSEGIELEPGTSHWKNYDISQFGWRYWESPIQSYRTLWESINGKGSWDINTWAWVIEFKVLQPNITVHAKALFSFTEVGMRFKKGDKGKCEWEHMIVHDGKACLGIHYPDKRLTNKEKKIIETHLKVAAQEIENMRNNHAQ